jgi:hypothetical protein
MFKIDRHTEHRPSNGGAPPHDFLEAENVSLRLLLAQAKIDAQGLLDQAASTPASARHPASCRS